MKEAYLEWIIKGIVAIAAIIGVYISIQKLKLSSKEIKIKEQEAKAKQDEKIMNQLRPLSKSSLFYNKLNEFKKSGYPPKRLYDLAMQVLTGERGPQIAAQKENKIKTTLGL